MPPSTGDPIPGTTSAVPVHNPGSADSAPEQWERLALEDAERNEHERARRRHHRETVTIPRLRMLGALGLLGAVVLHNAALLGDLRLPSVLAFAGLWAVYLVVGKGLLSRYYRVDAPVDLSTLLLGTDLALFVLAIYVSGGERSWLFAVTCVRVADQIGTSQRRAFVFATIGMVLHGLLVLYMAFIEQRGFPLQPELSKVALVYLLNLYLALAAGPGEAQRKRANRMAAVARGLIEELRHKTRQLEAERARAQAASEAKGAFLSNMSHEIRTPMTAVLGMAELLLSEPLEKNQREMTEAILSSGRALLALVNDVLDMSKVEAGQLELSLDDIDLIGVIQGALSPMRVLATGKGLTLKLECEGLPARRLQGDALRIKQVLLNLLGNAIKFTENGTVTVQVHASAQTETGCHIRIAVVDSGIGMTEAQLATAFEPFQQADLSTTRQFGGTGLGLSIAKRFVALMGGALTATSVPGQGSVFAFELDFSFAQGRSEPEPETNPLAADLLRARQPRLLVAEDTEVNRTLFARMLGHLGCRVDCVENGALAVERLSGTHPYDAVLLDWHMPVMDGIEAVTRIRRMEGEEGREPVPIVCVTASAFEDEIARCRDAGMDEVLSKPLVWAELERVLCRFTLEGDTKVRLSDRPMAQPRPDEVLDQSLLKELSALDGDPEELLRGLFDELFAAADEVLAAIDAALAQDDLGAVQRQAHALKGSAAGVGACLLAAHFADLEARARAGDKDLGEPLTQARQTLTQTRAAVSVLLDDLASEAGPSRQHA